MDDILTLHRAYCTECGTVSRWTTLRPVGTIYCQGPYFDPNIVRATDHEPVVMTHESGDWQRVS